MRNLIRVQSMFIITFLFCAVGATAQTVDVQPLNVTLSSYSVTAGGSVTVNWQIRNNGTGTASSSYSQVRITTSSTSYGALSNNVGSEQATGSIGAGATVNQSETVTVPSTAGTYYVWVIADNTNLLTQTNVSNDETVSAALTISAPTVTPTITSVSPNPVTGSNSAQPFYINGTNFQSGCTVTLRDLTAGQTFTNRTIVNQTSTQIQLSVNFTTAADNWSVEVINPGNASSGQFNFSVVAPTGTSLPLGIDVSQFQNVIDWGQVNRIGGKVFVLIRASAGAKTTDASFAHNVIAAKDSGLIVGVYHFAYPQYYTAHQEAQKFLSVASPYIGAGYLPPTVDIEDSPSDTSYPYLMGIAALSQWINDWCSEVEQVSGVKPIIYSTPYYAQNYFDSSVNQYPFWVVTNSGSADSDPGNIGIWSAWMFQQYQYGGSGGTCAGITGSVDLDSFNGTLDSLRNLTNRVPTVVDASAAPMPTHYSLAQNYPNPFNPSTIISYQLPTSTLVVLKVFDVLGREVETLVNARQSAGNHSVRFNASDLPSGVYFYTLQAGTYHHTKKLLLLK